MDDKLSTSPRATWPVALIIALLACAAIIVAIKSSAGDNDDNDRRPASAPIKVDLASLKMSTTETTFKKAPRGADKGTADGTVVHPRHVVAIFRAPGAKPFAKIGPHQFGDTWLPVVGKQSGWVRVMLPSRPNGSTGWLQAKALRKAHSSDQIRVHLASRTLELIENGTQVGSWPVAVGASATPTPTGRTFLLGQLVDDNQSYSPVILPLGAHSQTLDTYGGGPGTVAIHGWTDPSVFGQAVSHGCIRVPDDALERLRSVPLGSVVQIDNS